MPRRLSPPQPAGIFYNFNQEYRMSDKRKEMQRQFEFWAKKVDEEGIADSVTDARKC